jgi:hypothetical protein
MQFIVLVLCDPSRIFGGFLVCPLYGQMFLVFLPPSDGRLQYIHCSPVTCRRWRKESGAWGVSGSACHWRHKCRDLALQVGGWTQGWRPWFVNRLLLRTPMEWKLDDIWRNLLRKAMAERVLFCRRRLLIDFPDTDSEYRLTFWRISMLVYLGIVLQMLLGM